MSDTAIIETENLTKLYKNETAVSDLSFKVNPGEIFGFLGPNGAGKTTTLLMLMGLTEPTSGKARVLGRAIPVFYRRAKQHSAPGRRRPH
ncbi:MAG: ATP-binding cassette domain-containing protein [Deltaproteobacteria bacterium]